MTMDALLQPGGRFLALATDGDGTLVKGGRMARTTLAALRRWRRSGRRLLLTTGETPHEVAEFPHLELFDLVIAENGALIYDPATGKEQVLAPAPPARLLRALRRVYVEPLQRGRVILATEHSQERKVVRVLADLNLTWQIQRNRRDLMILPPGVNKAAGLAVALKRLRLAPQSVIGVGDAENDVCLIRACGTAVAVANALSAVQAQAQIVTEHGYGRGVVELVDQICPPARHGRRGRLLASRAAAARERAPRACRGYTATS